MSESDWKHPGPYDALPKMRTPSGRFVYDPGAAPDLGSDPAELRRILEESRATRDKDARADVPEPIEAPVREDGALVVAGEDAAKAHTEAVVPLRVVPQMPSGSLRIVDGTPLREPARPPDRKRRFGLIALICGAVVFVILGATAVRSPPKGAGSPASSSVVVPPSAGSSSTASGPSGAAVPDRPRDELTDSSPDARMPSSAAPMPNASATAAVSANRPLAPKAPAPPSTRPQAALTVASASAASSAPTVQPPAASSAPPATVSALAPVAPPQPTTDRWFQKEQ